MAEKTIYENPKTTDTIIFDLPCANANNCFSANPYKVNNLTIYFVERDFYSPNYGEYEKITYNDDLKERTEYAQSRFCLNPTTQNELALESLQGKLESSYQKTNYYFKECRPVKVIGGEDEPAWSSIDSTNSLIELVETDLDGNAQFGHFQYSWSPQGSVREGDYFICWTWTPILAGDSISAHIPFGLIGNPAVSVTIPSQLTPEEKYEVLLERYLPEMYKFSLGEKDITPVVIDYFNKAIAKGFRFTEDMANQLIDLFDANVLHESLLVYLGNLFNLKLKSSDPTLWRRQIKEAIPLFKSKGTIGGLQSSFTQAGMRLDKITRMWQVVSKYFWQESFQIQSDDDFIWDLNKTKVNDELTLWLRTDDTYDVVSNDNVEFSDYYGTTKMSWVGEDLQVGDIVRIKYQYKEYPNTDEQTIDEYIQNNCLLGDLRDEKDQEYPPKNWNVKVIEEDDTLFDVIIPLRHAYHDWLVFGQIRTEFPYSENIYNMEEYNGSTRDSYDACFIDKSFIDPCSNCLGSLFTADVAVEELSDDRMTEIIDIFNERTPFHAVVHSINLTGEVNEYVVSPVESIDMLVSVSQAEFVISGESNPFFHRVMHEGMTNWAVHRDDLASDSEVATGTGTAYNRSIKIIVPNDSLESVSADHHILEVISSTNIGTYHIDNIQEHIADVSGSVNEPLDTSRFAFKLSNVTYRSNGVNISQSDVFKFVDDSVDFESLSVKTSWDITNNPDYSGGAWKITTSSGTYEITDILPNNILVLQNDGTLAVGSGITYTLYTDEDQEVAAGTTGSISVDHRALIDLLDTQLVNINEFIKINDYVVYDNVEYLVIGFSGNNLYIEGYEDGDASGVPISIRRRILDNAVGYFGYSGIVLETTNNYETELGIVNGYNNYGGVLTNVSPVNPAIVGQAVGDPEVNISEDNNFVENYIIKLTIASTEYYYKVEKFNNNEITLSGTEQSFGSFNTDGTDVDFSVIHIVKTPVSSQWITFDALDRRGKDTVEQITFSDITGNTAIVALSQPPGNNFEENVAHEEDVTFEVTYRDGTVEQGEI
jgi:hypothetical protein